jgi:hypothetical protein
VSGGGVQWTAEVLVVSEYDYGDGGGQVAAGGSRGVVDFFLFQLMFRLDYGPNGSFILVAIIGVV